MNIPAIQAILFVVFIAVIKQWWLRCLFAVPCVFSILASVQEERWRMRGLIAILLLLVPSIASADIVQIAHRRSVCDGQQCRVETAYASAVTIGKNNAGDCVLLTAGHVADAGASVYVAWHAQWIPGKVIASRHDQAFDAAVVIARLPGDINCDPLSDDVPDQAEVMVCGFPGGE